MPTNITVPLSSGEDAVSALPPGAMSPDAMARAAAMLENAITATSPPRVYTGIHTDGQPVYKQPPPPFNEDVVPLAHKPRPTEFFEGGQPPVNPPAIHVADSLQGASASKKVAPTIHIASSLAITTETTAAPKQSSTTTNTDTTSSTTTNNKSSNYNNTSKSSKSKTKKKSSPRPSMNSENNPFDEDPNIPAAVHSIIHLLQTYGPLSYEQLKCNMVPELVPLPEAPKTVSTPKTLPPPKLGQMQDQLKEKEKQNEAEGGKKVRPPKDKLQKVLDILHELGVIHLIDKTRLPNNEDSGTMTAATINNNANYKPTAQAFEAAYNDPNPIYCFGNGVPRMDTVWPEQILNEIKLAGEEVLRMKERVDILKKTLLAVDEANKQANNVEGGENEANSSEPSEAATEKQPATKPKRKGPTTEQHAIQTLKQLYSEYPEIVQDPVYAAALRMFRINVGNKINHHKIFVENDAEVTMITNKVLLGGGNNKGGNTTSLKSSSSDNLQKGLKRSASTDSSGPRKRGRKKKGQGPKKKSSSDSLKGAGGRGNNAPAVQANASWA